jgi:dTDP-4-amino-4,6-dideoxygalactose transaminase
LCRFEAFPRDRVEFSEHGASAAERALRSCAWSMFTSPEVDSFERELAEFIGSNHVVLVNSCTTALTASLMAADIGPGDFVAVPAYTYIGTCMPILAVGARPVLVDIDPVWHTMDVTALQNALQRYPIRAAIHAHLFGCCRNVEQIVALCKQHGAAYIADAAQFLGDRTATSMLADAGATCFSFGESKLLRLGEGGAVATNSCELAERLRLSRHEGESWTRLNSSRLEGFRPNVSDVLGQLASVRSGLNFRPLSVMAAIGRAMLRELPDQLERTRSNASMLLDALARLPGLTLPAVGPRTWWTFPLLTTRVPRDVLLAGLLAEGVPAGVHFPRLLEDHPIVKAQGAVRSDESQNARAFGLSHLVLPIYPRLTEIHMQQIAAAFTKVMSHAHLFNSEEARARANHVFTRLPIAELCSGLFLFLNDDDPAWAKIRQVSN